MNSAVLNDSVFPKMGIIANNVQGVFQQAVIEGITQVATQHGYGVIVVSYRGTVLPVRSRGVAARRPCLARRSA